MSRIALVVVVIVALALGAIFFILQSAPAKGPAKAAPIATTPLEGVSPDRITAIHVTPPGDAPLALARSADGWTLEADGVAWPVDPMRVQGTLRALGEAAPNDPGTPPPTLTNPIRVEIVEGAQTTTIEIATAALAGRVPITSSNGFVGYGATAIPDMLTKPDPRAWRLASPFPGLDPPTATHLTISTGDKTIELARLDNRWRVVRPVAARANPTVVSDALDRIAGYTIKRFFDDASPAPDNTGLDAPLLTLSLARDTRADAGANTPTDRRSIILAGSVRSGTTWFARIDKPSPVIVELAGPAPTSFSTAARNYLATTATDVAPADVGAIRLTWADGLTRTLERKLDAWIEKPSDAPADAAPINEALAFLHDEPGEPQESLSEKDVRSLVTVELQNFAGAPLDILNVGYNADGEMTVRGANVVWLYGNYRGPALFKLPSFTDLPAPADVPTAPKREEYPSK